MLITPKDNDNDKGTNDFFESETVEAPNPPKEPEPRPDEPQYWERDESQWDHLLSARPSRRRLVVWVGAAAFVLLFGVGVWLRWFSPCVDEAVQFGYVDCIERRGTVFQTYEGVLIPYKELMDTSRLYRRDFVFSAAHDTVAASLLRMQLACRPVAVHYRRYHAVLPWRGASQTIVTAVDTVDPRTILPPEFNPLYKEATD